MSRRSAASASGTTPRGNRVGDARRDAGLRRAPRELAVTVAGDRRLVDEQRERLHGQVRAQHRDERGVAGPGRRERGRPRGLDRSAVAAEHGVDVRGVDTVAGEALPDLRARSEHRAHATAARQRLVYSCRRKRIRTSEKPSVPTTTAPSSTPASVAGWTMNDAQMSATATTAVMIVRSTGPTTRSTFPRLD